MQEITDAGSTLTMEGLLRISHTFAAGSGLLQSARLRDSIASAHASGHAASMIMLGEAAVSTGPFPGSRPVGILYDRVSLCR